MDLETTWIDERHANGKPRLYRILGWYAHRAHGFQTWQTGAMSVCARVGGTHVDDPLICAKPATLEEFLMQITKLVVIKRGEALDLRVPVVYLRFEHQACTMVNAGDSQ